MNRISPAPAWTGAGEITVQLQSPLDDGSHWFETADGRGVLYEGTPPFVAEMEPQGFLGAAFARTHPELDLPPRLQDWNDDHRLIALARRGEDAVGNLMIGEESFERFWRARDAGVVPVADDAYPEMARTAANRPTGSPVGGEGPKFLAFSETRDAHVLVKFTSGTGDAADQRWSDLLACEALALETLAHHGFETPACRVIDVEGRCFLELERYDRSGAHGRHGVLSMAVLDHEYVGLGSHWSAIAGALAAERIIPDADVQRIRWLDTFGDLVANTDRHPGNISFYADSPEMASGLSLAPVYDMLPMAFTPVEGRTPEVAFTPRPPGPDAIGAWPEAARAASDFWSRVATADRITPAFRSVGARAGDTLEALRERAEPGGDGPRPG